MCGISTSSVRAVLLATLAGAAAGSLPVLAAALPPVTRAEMIDIAKRMANHPWVVRAANLEASCLPHYKSSFRKDENITGVAYDWGGMDDNAEFDRKLAAGFAAGSHADQGVTSCTSGVDCSGFVALCWKQAIKYGTATIATISDPINGNVYRDLKPGDALNLPGTHIVLFDSYNPDGTINVYEASGSRSRVVLSRTVPWSRFTRPNKVYQAIRYDATVDW